MHINANTTTYSYPTNKFNTEMYGFSILGIMSQYRFTEQGIDALNEWMDDVGAEEITEDRRIVLENGFHTMFANLLTSGDAIKHRNGEWEQTVKWWLTTTHFAD